MAEGQGGRSVGIEENGFRYGAGKNENFLLKDRIYVQILLDTESV